MYKTQCLQLPPISCWDRINIHNFTLPTLISGYRGATLALYQALPSITLESSTLENVEQYRLCYLSQDTQVVSHILDANHHQHQASLQFLKNSTMEKLKV